jgi:hypothetical protein
VAELGGRDLVDPGAGGAGDGDRAVTRAGVHDQQLGVRRLAPDGREHLGEVPGSVLDRDDDRQGGLHQGPVVAVDGGAAHGVQLAMAFEMGDPGFEPGTSSLSETRSNQLS